MNSKIYGIYEHHRNLAVAYHLVAGKLYRPSHLKVFISDFVNRRGKAFDNSVHCQAAIRWLFDAQDITGTEGISAGYSFSWGWRWAYPETSGYIIPTLFDFARHFSNTPTASECRNRALRVADWLVNIQLPNGAYSCGLFPVGQGSLADKVSLLRKPTALETGQILSGLSRAFEETGDQHYLEAALKADDWLVESQSPNGSWSVSHQSLPHSFDSFITRPLVTLSRLSGRTSYQQTARENLDWCLCQQMENGYFNNCSHSLGSALRRICNRGNIGRFLANRILFAAFVLFQLIMRPRGSKQLDKLYSIYSNVFLNPKVLFVTRGDIEKLLREENLEILHYEKKAYTHLFITSKDRGQMPEKPMSKVRRQNEH